MIEYVSLAMIKAEKYASVLLYASGADPYFEEILTSRILSRILTRVFYFEEGPRVQLDLWPRPSAGPEAFLTIVQRPNISRN